MGGVWLGQEVWLGCMGGVWLGCAGGVAWVCGRGVARGCGRGVRGVWLQWEVCECGLDEVCLDGT